MVSRISAPTFLQWLPNPFRSFANGHTRHAPRHGDPIEIWGVIKGSQVGALTEREQHECSRERKSCQELIHERWKQRQEDLKDLEFEGLGFDYVEPHTFTDQPEGYWRWQFSWGGPAMSCAHTLTNTARSIAWNTGTWTGETVRMWSCSRTLKPGLRCRRWCNAPLLSLCIVHLHRLPGAAPAAGSCSNAADGNHCGSSGREAGLDNSAMDSVALHLHSIADAGRGYYSSKFRLPRTSPHGSSCGKKNKKRFDRCNRMGYKGIIN